MPYLSPYHRPVPNAAKFRESVEILLKWAHSVARLKIPCSAENSRPWILDNKLEQVTDWPEYSVGSPAVISARTPSMLLPVTIHPVQKSQMWIYIAHTFS